jgi:gamma-glutamylcyclotransferase (GGCT)/AIG2-like uncharacterized protein YtfP
MMRIRKLFVYGSLHTASNPFYRLLMKNSRKIGEGTVQGNLYFLGRYPGAVITKDGNKIYGSVYLLNDLQLFDELDKYEEYNPLNPQGSLFIRKTVTVTGEDGKKHRAWIYVYNREVSGKRLIKSGNYGQYRKRKVAVKQ